MSTTWQIEMADLPAYLAASRVISAPFCGLSMITADGGFPDSFFAIVSVGDGRLPLEVTGNAFALIATLASGPHGRVIVLHRRGCEGLFDAAGLFNEHDAPLVVEKLRGQG